MKSSPKKSRRPKAVAPPPPPKQAEPSPSGISLRRHALPLLAILAVALLAWSNSFGSGFVFDNKVLMQDSRIKAVTPQNIDLIFHQEFWYGWALTGLYRPLATLSFLFNYAILGNGMHPAGYHWINFLLHAVNMLLVYALGLRVFRGTSAMPALALTAIWGLHPVLTESVTNIIGRSDLMAALGVLAGLLCHVQAASARGWRKGVWLAGLMLAVGIGLFSKESAAVVPAVLLIYDVAFATVSWSARAAGYAALLPPFAFFLYIRSDVLSKLPPVHVKFGDNPLTGADFWTARFTAVKVIGRYLWRLLWPQHLSADYSYNQIPLVTWRWRSWEDWTAVIALVVCVAAAVLAIRCYRLHKPLFFFIAFFFIALAPTSNVFLLIGTIMAERFLYLPAIGFAGCVVAVLYAWPRLQRHATAILAVAAIALAARTYARNADWQTEKTLFTHDARVTANSFKAHMSLAMVLNDGTSAGLDAAIVEAARAVEILNDLPDVRKIDSTYINLGSYYRQKGDLLAARNPETGIVSNAQSDPWYRKSLATLLVAERLVRVTNEENRREDVANGGSAAFEYGSYQLDREIGRVHWRLGEYKEALAAYTRGRARHWDADFQVEIAGVLRSAGARHEAAITLLEGIIMDPSQTKYASGLVEIYRQMDPKGCAIRGTGQQISLNVECPAVHDDICAAAHNIAESYRKANQMAAANRTIQSAITQLGCPVKFFQ